MNYVINWKKDVRVERFAASSKGGQNANKTENNVRLTHIPTGIKSQATSERSLDANFKSAIKILMLRVLRFLEAQRDSEKVPKELATFGYQRRTYYGDGANLVKDHETGVEDTFHNVVKKGKLDSFIEAALRSLL